MWNKKVSALFFGLIGVVLAAAVVEPVPKLSAHQEGIKQNGAPLSKVTITVGEKNGFAYTVYGETNSAYKIAVSGDYYNNENDLYSSYTRLYLVAEPSIADYWIEQIPDGLNVLIYNRPYGEQFRYTITLPRNVRPEYLREGQINETSVLFTGPTRSQVRA